MSLENNEITKFQYDRAYELETVFLSGNKLLGTEVLHDLKNAVNLTSLSLGGSSLSYLSVDSFANLVLLESLSLDKNSISKIDFGLFSHQTNLNMLNLSYNAIEYIDFHIFVSSLEILDISGNRISQIDSYSELKQILPELRVIGLEGNNWKCEYFSKLKASLTSQEIYIREATKPVRNTSNIAGIECVTSSTEVISYVKNENDDKVAAKMNQLVDTMNAFNIRMNEFERNKTSFNDVTFNLQRDVLNLRSDLLQIKLPELLIGNTTSTNEVRTFVEQMNNMTLEKQKLGYDQLIHKIMEQNVEIAKYKVEIEKVLMNLKIDAGRNEPKSAHLSNSSGFTGTETFFIGFVSIIVFGFLILSAYKVRKFLVLHFHQMSKYTASRRNSANTVVTFDNTSA